MVGWKYGGWKAGTYCRTKTVTTNKKILIKIVPGSQDLVQPLNPLNSMEAWDKSSQTHPAPRLEIWWKPNQRGIPTNCKAHGTELRGTHFPLAWWRAEGTWRKTWSSYPSSVQSPEYCSFQPPLLKLCFSSPSSQHGLCYSATVIINKYKKCVYTLEGDFPL